ncbi:MAG: hypothetical protein R2745_21395 [Vicinamibacterales bacterium]
MDKKPLGERDLCEAARALGDTTRGRLRDALIAEALESRETVGA